MADASGPKCGLFGPPPEEGEVLELERHYNGDEPADAPPIWSNSINLNIEVIIDNSRSILSSRVDGAAVHNCSASCKIAIRLGNAGIAAETFEKCGIGFNGGCTFESTADGGKH